jgi:NADH:ubiquinone oxidoreductase subunit E
MGKKLLICRGKACKNADPDKRIMKFAKSKLGKKRIKKTKCLGLCKSTFAVEYKGKIQSCPTKKDLEELLDKKD